MEGQTFQLRIPEQIGRRSEANRPPFRSKSATPGGRVNVVG
ncbi:MAG: hypothetical protein Q8O55_03970 [Dehalococcoidales bacterium]|nr:hypothetical protein [Dehalococcoidales bacterium]